MPSPDPAPTLLSQIIARTSRRGFLTRMPIVAAGLAACTRTGGGQAADTAQARADTARGAGDRNTTFNSNSLLDTALDRRHQMAGRGTEPAAYRRYDPALPPVSDSRTIQVHWRAREVPIRISPDLAVNAWTFEGDVPGPILHVRQGDTVEFTLTNEGATPHSMDFHAAQINPKEAFRSVMQGESVTFTFRPRFAGAYMYHCGTDPVLMHIGAGMYGAIIVDPPQPLPPAREFVLVQSEWYLREGPSGVMIPDYQKMLSTMPDHVVFNGRPGQYITEPIRVKRGERVRFYVVCAGPTHPCNFHVVGEQFDTTYLGSPPGVPMRGVQTFAVAPGGGMVFDIQADIVGEFPFVNHGFGHGQKGSIGFLVVEE